MLPEDVSTVPPPAAAERRKRLSCWGSVLGFPGMQERRSLPSHRQAPRVQLAWHSPAPVCPGPRARSTHAPTHRPSPSPWLSPFSWAPALPSVAPVRASASMTAKSSEVEAALSMLRLALYCPPLVDSPFTSLPACESLPKPAGRGHRHMFGPSFCLGVDTHVREVRACNRVCSSMREGGLTTLPTVHRRKGLSLA
jgi:hypothetical protein